MLTILVKSRNLAIFACFLLATGCSNASKVIKVNARFTNGFVVDSGSPVRFNNKGLGFVDDVTLDPNSGDLIVVLCIRADVPIYNTDYVEYHSPVPNAPGRFEIVRDPKFANAQSLQLKDGDFIDGKYFAPGAVVPPEN